VNRFEQIFKQFLILYLNKFFNTFRREKIKQYIYVSYNIPGNFCWSVASRAREVGAATNVIGLLRKYVGRSQHF
jgi:hypothetical protein